MPVRRHGVCCVFVSMTCCFTADCSGHSLWMQNNFFLNSATDCVYLPEWGQVVFASSLAFLYGRCVGRQNHRNLAMSSGGWERLLTNEPWWMGKTVHSDEKKLHYTSSVRDGAIAPKPQDGEKKIQNMLADSSWNPVDNYQCKSRLLSYFCHSSHCCHVIYLFLFLLWLSLL